MTPREELEARLTALLLGELSAGEEAVVREAIAKDPALAQLHARLQQTIGLVSEAARSAGEPAATQAPPLRLSEDRREKMLRSFKVIQPQPSAWARWRKVSMRDVSSVAAMLVVLGLVAWVLFGDTLAKEKNPQRTTAISGMRAISDALLAYQQKHGAASSREARAESLAEQVMASRDAFVVADSASLAATEEVANGRVAALGITPARSVAVADGRAGGRSSFANRLNPNSEAALRPARGSPDPQRVQHADVAQQFPAPSSFQRAAALESRAPRAFPTSEFGLNQVVDRAASGPEAETPPPPADVAQQGSQRVILPALAETSSALGDNGVTLNLWAENQPSATPLGEVRDLQRGREQSRAGLIAGTTLAREPLSAGGMGGGGGGGANAFGWSGQTPAQQVNPTWRVAAPSESGLPANRSGDEMRFSVMSPLEVAASSAAQSKQAKPAIQTSEPRSYRSRIILPQDGELAEAFKREPQIQTGPISTSEIELRAQMEPVEKPAKLKDDGIAKRPAPTAPIPQPEVATAENAFSTFSLNVSDVSFKLAAAALEKGQMPDPATVRSEEFINTFDYRDPEPAGSAPIAFAWERARYPFARDRDLVRFSVKTAASGRQPGRPLNLVLLLDNSGSMERADRIRIRQECLRVLAGQLQPQDRVSVVAFARTARLWVDGLPGNQAGELPQRVGGLTPEGGTNLEDAMNLAYQTARRHFLANGVNRVVLLTDGAANLGDVQPESLKKKVEAQRKQGIALDCFGIGWDGLNDELLEALSRNGDGRYGFVNTPEAAQDEFASQLTGALKVAASDVKVQVEWNPRRVTAYRQIGYAKHQLKKEQFRDNTVDAAEIGAAEAGNALYTVQVNPAGEGPLGTMRVRFKVPGTSDYREHEWPLPYEGAAKSLDQSSATLRLAASASAFSEWLVSSPFAAEVTPDKLLGYLGNVPEAFSSDPRPKKLEWMIRQTKSVSGK